MATTSVASTTSSTTISADGVGTKGTTIVNTDANPLYLLIGGGTASATNYTVRLDANDYYEVPEGFLGLAISGVWAADGSGAAIVTEF